MQNKSDLMMGMAEMLHEANWVSRDAAACVGVEFTVRPTCDILSKTTCTRRLINLATSITHVLMLM